MKISFTDGSTLDVLYLCYHAELSAIDIGINTNKSFDEIRTLFSNKVLINEIKVHSEDDKIQDVYTSFTAIKTMSVDLDTPSGNADIRIMLKHEGVEKDVETMQKNLLKMQESLSNLNTVETTVEGLTEQTNMLIECILEMSEIVYGV